MPYRHLIAATVMTLGVCQGCSLVASFSILTSSSRGPSAIAEPLVSFGMRGVIADVIILAKFFCQLVQGFWSTDPPKILLSP